MAGEYIIGMRPVHIADIPLQVQSTEGIYSYLQEVKTRPTPGSYQACSPPSDN
jgi:hypothetical protein